MNKCKNTAFKIVITDNKNPNTITTYTDLRFKNLLAHAKKAIDDDKSFTVYIKFYGKLPSNVIRYTWLNDYSEFVIFRNSTGKYRFFDHTETYGDGKYSKIPLNHIESYERRFDKEMKYY